MMNANTSTGSLTNLDNYWPTRDSSGNETGDQALDPGHPLCLKYLSNVVMDVVNNYQVDGVHYDYIRFTANNQGYNPTSVARYNARYGLTGQPANVTGAHGAGDPSDQWDQWRRDQVSALVRQVYARIQATKPQVLQSASFVTWNPSPTSSTRASFKGTRPYYDVYSDWDAWEQEGILDFAVPMTYYDDAVLPADYIRWMNFEKDRKFNRHMVVGPGIYKDFLSDSISQLKATRNVSPAGNYANGFCGYSYACPFVVTKPTGYGAWADFKPTFVSQVCSSWAPIPDRPWKSSPTKGHISGTVTYLTGGAWADGATVTITGPENRSQICDGTGFYAFIDLIPGPYTVTVSKLGYTDTVTQVQVAIGSVTGNMYVTNLALSTGGLTITNVTANNITGSGATIAWTTNLPSTSQVEYGLTMSYGSSTTVDPTMVTSHSVTLTGLSPSTLYHFHAKSGVAAGTVASIDYTFTTDGPPVISNVNATNITSSSATITWTTNTNSDSTVSYGATTSYGSQATNASQVKTHSIVLTGLSQDTLYNYQCVSANAYGSAASTNYTFTTPVPANEVVVDNSDSGWASTGSSAWLTGSNAAVPKIGASYLYAHGDGSTTESGSTRKCTWTPALTTDGYYDVYAYYQMGTNRCSSAPYTVHYSGGQVTSVQNQWRDAANQGGWFLIAQDKPFVAANPGYVELTTLSADTQYVSADAAKWVYKSALDSTPPSVSIGAPSGALTSGGPVTYTIDYSDNVGVSAVTLADASIALNKTGTANATVSVTGTGTATRTVTITGITGDGTIGISIAAGTATDSAANTALAAGPSATFAVDNTAPTVASVTDEVYTTSDSSLQGWWSASDIGSGITRCEYAVGKTSGATDVTGWTDAGMATTATIDGLSLAVGDTYFISVRAVDNAGLISAPVSSAGVKTARLVANIPAALALSDGEVVALPARVVSAAFAGKLYVEESSRTAGIRVESSDIGLSWPVRDGDWRAGARGRHGAGDTECAGYPDHHGNSHQADGCERQDRRIWSLQHRPAAAGGR